MQSPITISKAASRREIGQYIAFPFRLYRSDPLWAPPIRFFEKREYHRGANPVLARSKHCLFLAKDENRRICGRVAAYVDPRYNAHHNTRLGFFGSFEARDQQTSRLLFQTIESWFREQNLGGIMGPVDPVAECWGFTIDGFDVPPVFLSPHSPPDYARWTAAAGYEKAKDLLVYEADSKTGYRIPDRFLHFEKKLLRRHPSIKARPLNPRRFDADVDAILEVTNEGVTGNWGYVPVEDDEKEALAGRLKLVADPGAVWFIEDKGRPVACCIGFPDLNIATRASAGRLLPLGWYRLLRAKRDIRHYRLWALAVRPDYHGMGLDVLLYMNLFRALQPRGIRLEANYVLEDNVRIVNALEKLGMQKIKRYRVFEKQL